MKTFTFDIETYANYTLFAFRDVVSFKLITFEIRGKKKSLKDKQKVQLNKMLDTLNIVTYNGLKFDEPITAYALTGASASEIFTAVQQLIKSDDPIFRFYQRIKCDPFIRHHIDIMDVARGKASLKLYGARIGAKKLQDLPYPPETILTDDEMDEVLDYCENDNILTQKLKDFLANDLALREDITEQYGINVMSDNGAKIAEKLLLHETGYTGKAPSIPNHVKYHPPKYIKFKSKQLKDLFKKIKNHKYLLMNTNILEQIDNDNSGEYTFFLDDVGVAKTTKLRHAKKSKKTISNSGNVILPDFIDAPIIIGGVHHQLGNGGVHGSVESTTIIPDIDETIVDIDYKSLYPSLIIQNNFVPKHIGKKFLKVYQGMYDRRNKELKPAMGKVKYGSDEYKKLDSQQNTMKLVLNSSFGKLGLKYSKLYDPSALLHITLTGQLTLMMVIEKLHLKGFKTFYANTDGITLRVRKKDVKKIQKITAKFDKETGLEMEYNFFKSSHIRDVNNFVNITSDDKVKSKGTYSEPNIEKNAQTPIVFEAVRKYLLDRTPYEETIDACKVVNDFCSSRQVTGGAMFGAKIPEMYPDDWEQKLNSKRGLTKDIINRRAKMEAVWVKEHGHYLGKVVRWYYSTKGASIHYKASGNLVPKSKGAKPMMDLKKKLPKDLDYEWYYKEAEQMLEDLGVQL